MTDPVTHPHRPVGGTWSVVEENPTADYGQRIKVLIDDLPDPETAWKLSILS